MAAVKRRVDLTTLEGIGRARQELYQDLQDGTISEQKAAEMEKVLRGQTKLKAEIPLRFLQLLASFEGAGVTQQLNKTIKEVGGFLGKPPRQLN